MRLVIQRVKSAQVSIAGSSEITGKIGKGLFVLLGVGENDGPDEPKLLAEKLLKMRIMSDEKDKMNLSVADTKTEVLVVSQFTLYADTSAGNRPSFIKAAKPEKASEFYETFISTLRLHGIKVETGKFGAYMNIKAELDGPVTIIV